MLRALSLLLIAFAPTFAAAGPEGTAPRKVLTIDEQARWSGVGRLNFPGGGFCSGALIAPDAVLTAAHCIAGKPPEAVRALRFVAGLRTGVYTANRRVADATIHPAWAGHQGGGRVIVAGDLALVRLETPISDVEARRFRPGPAPRPGDAVALVSYGRGREGALSIQEPCHVVKRWRASLELDCESRMGTSGAPVFRGDEIVAVISATDSGPRPDGGPRRSYAVLLEGALEALAGEGGDEALSPRGRVAERFRKAPGAAGSSGARLPGASRAPSE